MKGNTMKDEDKYQLVVFESLLKECGLDYYVCLFDLGEETVCLDLLSDGNLLVFNYERGTKHDTRVCNTVYDAVIEIISRVTDSVELEHELTSRFKESIGMGKGLCE